MIIEFSKQDLETLSDALLLKIEKTASIKRELSPISERMRVAIDAELGTMRLLNSYICDNLNHYTETKKKKGRKK